jgi:protein ImuB
LPLSDSLFALFGEDKQRQVIVAVNPIAAREGLAPGMPLTQARAIRPDLKVAADEPIEDAKALRRLAVGCFRFSPFVAPCAPDSLWIDATGVAHLFGGEAAMLHRIATLLRRSGLTARVAIAATPGAAWAWSHYGEPQVIDSESKDDLDALPVSALRLGPDVVYALWRVGIKTIGELKALPRSTLPLRFGKEMMLRLDQALGTVPESIDCIVPPKARRRELVFAEPVSAPEDLHRAAAYLVNALCADLDQAQEGARKLDLVFRRADHTTQAIRIGTARASRAPKHLLKLIAEHLDRIDPGFGIEAATLTAWRVASLTPAQIEADGSASTVADVATLVDCLANRIGEKNIYRFAAHESHIPERAQRRVAPLRDNASGWPAALPRPLRLFSPPEAVEVMALMPDHPPARFSWRGLVHKIRRADGPERVFGEWWRDAREVPESRDYFRVEDEHGERYWLYRDNRMTPNKTYLWYLHGVFG